MIAIWKTGHFIADAIADKVNEAYPDAEVYYTDRLTPDKIEKHDIHIAYGILRGTEEVFKLCDKYKKAWFNIDRGYFGANHFDGYYRVSLKSTQQTIGLNKIAPDFKRFDSLGVKIENKEDGFYTLICPPTDYICSWKHINVDDWISSATKRAKHPFKIRFKGDPAPLDFTDIAETIVYNSAVGWESLRRGIETHADFGILNEFKYPDLHKSYDGRRLLFSKMASLQMRLDEMGTRLCPLIQNLLSI